MRTEQFVLRCTLLASRAKTSGCPKLKARYPYLPNVRSITRELGNDYHGWAIYTDGGIRVVNGETLAGWCFFPTSSWAN